MIYYVESPQIIGAAGNLPKIIEEYFGRVRTNDQNISIARMKSPAGWTEPPQCPGFDEYTIVLKGTLRVVTKNHTYDIHEGQAILISKNEWVQYSSPFEGGAEYIAVCVPAFSPDTVNREDK